MSLLRVRCALCVFCCVHARACGWCALLGGLGGGGRVCDIGAVWLRERGCGVSIVGAGRYLQSTALSGTLPESIGQMTGLQYM